VTVRRILPSRTSSRLYVEVRIEAGVLYTKTSTCEPLSKPDRTTVVRIVAPLNWGYDRRIFGLCPQAQGPPARWCRQYLQPALQLPIDSPRSAENAGRLSTSVMFPAQRAGVR
jgi:hypothetical protein